MFLILCIDTCIYIQDDRTALYIASWIGHGAVIKLLLQHHADVNICMKVHESLGQIQSHWMTRDVYNNMCIHNTVRQHHKTAWRFNKPVHS